MAALHAFLPVAFAGIGALAAAPAQVPMALDLRVRAGDDPAWAAADWNDPEWTRARSRDVDPQGRLLWVGGRVALPERSDHAQPLALRLVAMASSEAYWNGVLIGRNGRPGATREEEEPGRLEAAFYIPPYLVRPGENLFAIRMSSHHLPLSVSTPVHHVSVATYGDTVYHGLRVYLPALVASGMVALGAIYFACLFLLDRRERSSLYLTILSFSVVGQAAAETLRAFVNYPYPWHVARLIAILACACTFGLSLVLYTSARLAPSGRVGRYVVAFSVILTAVLLLERGFDNKTALSLLAAAVVSLAAAASGARRRRTGALPAAAALLVFVLLLPAAPLHFLDRNFYLAVAGLVAVLFPLQILTLRRERIAREEAQLRSTRLELDLLKRQIQPHFLMNTLTALSEWIESDPATGVQMIEALAQEFRLLAQFGEQKLISTGQEIDLCRHHLRVVSLRSDRTFSLRADRVDRDRRIPPAVFHTLVENGLTHGALADGAEFRLEQTASADRVHYRLTCPPAPGAKKPRDPAGTGLSYVRARLTEAFGDSWTLRSGPSADGGWATDIDVPVG